MTSNKVKITKSNHFTKSKRRNWNTYASTKKTLKRRNTANRSQIDARKKILNRKLFKHQFLTPL